MGEAKKKQLADRAILKPHTLCCFCGEPAVEIDHVPPKCFFDGGMAPNGYVFPACVRCNRLTKNDDQALGVIMPMPLNAFPVNSARTQSLIRGTKKYSPELVREWASKNSAVAQKRMFRERFGKAGDALRHAGYGIASIGPLTLISIDRLVLKLGHSLFYKHVGRRLVGHCEYIMADVNEKTAVGLQAFRDITPCRPAIGRNNRSLNHRFDYRYNFSEPLGIFCAVIYFGGQLVFTLVAGEPEPMRELTLEHPDAPGEWPWRGLDSSYFKTEH